MKTVEMTEIKTSENKNFHSQGGPNAYIHYGEAKRLGLRSGDEIEIAIEGHGTVATYKIGQYIDWRNDQNRTFKGFEVYFNN